MNGGRLASDRDADSRRHRSISMVEEPTTMLRGALAFYRGASCSVKSRDPIEFRSNGLIPPRCGRRVNATNKNKRVLAERRGFWRMNSPQAPFATKQCFASPRSIWRAGSMLCRLSCQPIHLTFRPRPVGLRGGPGFRHREPEHRQTGKRDCGVPLVPCGEPRTVATYRCIGRKNLWVLSELGRPKRGSGTT